MTQQLTYGCSDGIPGRAIGGWGVLHRAGDPGPEVEARMVTLVSVDMSATMPDFPSRQQLTERVPRLRGHLDEDGTSFLLWRSVEAGLDHTRRPGNVFTHAARVALGDGVRAIDWAGSPAWREPYGAEQVRDAQPDAELPLPEPSGFAPVARTFREDDHLMRALPWMVDTLLHLWGGGDAVCLVEPRADRAASWVALLSWLLDERVGSGVSFALHEDRRSAPAMVERGFWIVSVVDQEDALASHAVVVDPEWEPDDTRAAMTGVWSLPSGIAVPRTEWAQLVIDLVWGDEATVGRVLAQRDALSRGLRRLQALPEGNDAQRAILHLALLGETGGSPELIARRLAELPPLAAASPVLRRLAGVAGLTPAVPPPVSSAPSVSLTGRPARAVGEQVPQASPAGILPFPSQGRVPAAPDAAGARLEWPTPADGVRATLALAARGAPVDVLASDSAVGWYDAQRRAEPAERTLWWEAAVHTLGPLPEQVVAATLASDPAPEFADRATALLMLVCTAHLAQPPLVPPSGPSWSSLQRFVAAHDAGDFAPLASYLRCGDPRHADAVSARSAALAAVEPTPGSVWALRTRSGELLWGALGLQPGAAGRMSVPEYAPSTPDALSPKERSWH